MTRLAALCVLLLVAGRAGADEDPPGTRAAPSAPADFQPGPPPDPSRGERADGKTRDRRHYGELLAVPRILLAPPRAVEHLIELPVRALLDLDAKYHWVYVVTHLFTSNDGKRGLRPVFRYISRLEPQLGVTYFDKKLLGPGSSLAVTFGAVLPALVFADANVHPHLPEPYKLDFGFTYLERNDWLFAGVGPASNGDLRATHVPYSYVQIGAANVAATLTLRANKRLHLHATQGWSYRFYGAGKDEDDRHDITRVYCDAGVGGCVEPKVDARRVPGFYTGANYFSEQLGLTFDTRTGGWSDRYWLRLDAFARYSQTPYAGGPQWMREHVMLDGGIPLGGHTRKLILRVSVDLLQPLASSTVPFSELVVVGGPDDFRGAPIGRFRDYTSVLGTLEYRWAVWMWLDAAVFNDWVGVFGRNFSGFSFDKLVPDVGAGLLLHTNSHFLMRVQVAYGFGTGVQTMFATTAGF